MNDQHQHIVKSHDDEQTALRDTLIQMGQLATNQLESALDAVARRDEAAAREVIANDEHIDAMEQHINHDVIRLIQRGPLASDLRVILAALRVASDIERIGDYAANIAKRSLVLNQSPPLTHTRGSIHRAVPRIAHLHDGRPACDYTVHASAVHGQESGTHRRPRHQYRRERVVLVAWRYTAATSQQTRWQFDARRLTQAAFADLSTHRQAAACRATD